MSADPFLDPDRYPTRYNRCNPDGSGRHALRPINGEPPRPTRSQWLLENFLFFLSAILLGLGCIALYSRYSPAHNMVPNHVAEGLRNDRVNILLFGVGGEDHPQHDDHADAILFVSLQPSTRQAAVVSIPRDLWVRLNGYGTHRINYANEIGDRGGYPGRGPGLLCDTVSQVFNQPVHAYVRVDFSAFEKLIDEVGGIDVYCQRGFYDQLFHDGFRQGWHHLNGRRALAYSRYRYVIGPEGDNFARELRQQQVMNALLTKLRGLNPQQTTRFVRTITTLSSATKTNLTTSQIIELYQRFHDIDPAQIRHVSLKPVSETFMVTRIGDPGEAVRPRNNDYAGFQQLERQIFTTDRQVSTPDQIQLTGSR